MGVGSLEIRNNNNRHKGKNKMKTNMKTKIAPITTHEGAIAKRIGALEQLKRSVMTCMLWENGFYEDGVTVADRISNLVPVVSSEAASELAVKARTEQKLRHVPLLIVLAMARNKMEGVRKTLASVIQRPDEITEFMSLYWKQGRCPIAKQIKLGLVDAFSKFDEYAISKYNQDKDIKLRDVMFLVHAKPADAKGRSKTVEALVKKGVNIRGAVKRHKDTLFSKLASDTLSVPDTWETALSASTDKTETWTRLLQEKKLGALALLRNLRNMQECGVDRSEIISAIKAMKTERVLPFRFISASTYAPWAEPYLEDKMLECLAGSEKLNGKTVLLVDISGSMNDLISAKSDLRRVDAAYGLSILLREICEDVRIFSFSGSCIEIPARRGFALRDAIDKSQSHGSTYLGRAVDQVKQLNPDRIIVITDEQSHDNVSSSGIPSKAYMLNVGTNRNGVGYGKWTNISGWSEAIVNFILQLEKEGA